MLVLVLAWKYGAIHLSFGRVDEFRDCFLRVSAPETFGQGPASDSVDDFTPEGETGVEAIGGVFLLQTSGVTAQHERWLRPQPPFHRSDVRADVVRQVDVVVLPDDKDVAFRRPAMALNFSGSDRNQAA